MTSPTVEPVYTQVDMSSAAPSADDHACSVQESESKSVSATYSDQEKPVSTTVKFFDDSESEP